MVPDGEGGRTYYWTPPARRPPTASTRFQHTFSGKAIAPAVPAHGKIVRVSGARSRGGGNQIRLLGAGPQLPEIRCSLFLMFRDVSVIAGPDWHGRLESGCNVLCMYSVILFQMTHFR